MSGKFIISLDYEKSWGFNDLISEKKEFEKFLFVDNIVDKKLDLFSYYNIKVTWAIVTGMIDFPSDKNLFSHREYKSLLSHSFFIKSLMSGNVPIKSYTCCIDNILSKGHEVASHTHTHVYCDDYLYSKEEILNDIKYSVNTINRGLNDLCSTIVFPRNQVNKDILMALGSMGIKCFRGNNFSISDSVTEKTKIRTKLVRYLDSYLPILPISYSTLSVHESGLINIPASRFLRVTKFSLLNVIHLYRIKEEMTNAAINGENYHLWWHPHNFIKKETEGFYVLNEILKHFKYLNVKYDFESSTMGALVKENDES
ncbi:polysaccharide deacetylase family protein [Aliivibrio logei]|uniref:NodB homology domain-containing protein n=1 Tax=Aliivibrio logei 5S-186 TaxID=626086 RepID=A0ABX3ARN0_ALILO|nr:polysaccharide deacetylase family protein [Aliivibrio logei]OEF10072.1 hypothetical protein A1Q5_14040 [Aliivibrio logei 5S-186]